MPEPKDLWYELVAISKGRPVFPDWPKVSSQFVNPALDELWAGRTDAKAATAKMAKDINDFLAANPQ